MKKFFLTFSIFLLGISSFVNASINLEENCQDFILDLKKIDVPEHPDAFNGSIVRWQERWLLCFREIDTTKPILETKASGSSGSSAASKIGLVWLDEEFNPEEKAQMLPLETAEDARLLEVNGSLYFIYNGIDNHSLYQDQCHMHTAELHFENNEFSLQQEQCLSVFENNDPERCEKNWVPFENNGELLLAYSINPHTIFSPVTGSEECQTLSQTSNNFYWHWGELRGGTPALLIDSNQYLSFFHSSINLSTEHSDSKEMPHYFMGAYLFENSPSFTLTHISPEPIIGEGFYSGPSYEPYWHPLRVVFPTGIAINEDFVWVSYGRQDHEIWVAKMDKKALLESLIPIFSDDE